MNNVQDLRLQSQTLFSEGLTLFQAGKVTEAEKKFLNAIRIDPNNFDALNLAGICAYQKCEYTQALNFLKNALAINNESPYTHNTLGLIYQNLGQFTEALEEFNLAISLQDSIPEIHNNLANALRNLKQLDAAIIAYQNAITLRSNYPEAYSNLGVCLNETGQYQNAIASLERAIHLNPHFSEAFNNLGNVHHNVGNYRTALNYYKQAIHISPGYLDAYINCANTYKSLKEFDDACDYAKKVLELNPQNPRATYLLGEIFYDQGDSLEAQKNYQATLDLNPNDANARFALTVAQIPKVAVDSNQMALSRTQLEKELGTLEAWLKSSRSSGELINCGSRSLFYLAYQESNNKKLLSRYAKMRSLILQSWQQANGLLLTKSRGISSSKIRLGIVSAHFSNHPVWHAITKGVLLNLDKSQFQIHLFDLGMAMDEETELAEKNSASYTKVKQDLSKWCCTILDKNIDVLLYPEIGMDPLTLELASLRLAPLQLASWGHPETTGIETIDYFISAEDLEPENAEENYSEKIFLLPNLGAYFLPSTNLPRDLKLENLGLTDDIPLILCPGSPSKYNPENDLVFVEIAKKLGQCQLIFFNFESKLTQILRGRLEKIFEANNLIFTDYVRFIPFLSKENFYGLMKQSDLYLDTIGFSGFNTAMQAIECNLPIVTKDGKFMRGRLASGILKRLGLGSLVAKTNADYVLLAVELITNQTKASEIRQQIEQKKEILFRDLQPVHCLEEFLVKQAS
jgi:predicted O-linked N-acetylglucosamine transferase (SPINDLY family)